MDYKNAAQRLNILIEKDRIYKSQELLNMLYQAFNFGRSYTSCFLSEMKKDHTIHKESHGYKFNNLPIYYKKIINWHKNVQKMYNHHSDDMSYRELLKLQDQTSKKISKYEDKIREVKKILISLGFTPDAIDGFLNK